MLSPVVEKLWRRSLLAAAVAFFAVMLGSLTRITGLGMSCPQWPACTLDSGTVWEWLHRAVALLETLFVGWMAAAAWPLRRRSPAIAATLATVLTLFAVQVILGALTVRVANSPYSVVLHWGAGMAFLASLIVMAILARTANAPQQFSEAPRVLPGVLAATSAIAFAAMCVGAYVSSSGAGLACLSLPGCAGNVLVRDSGQFVQMVHRFVAAASLLSASVAFAIAWRAGIRVRALAGAGLLLLFVQVLLGLLNVALRLPPALREAHAANAALTFLVFVVATLFASFECAPARGAARAT